MTKKEAIKYCINEVKKLFNHKSRFNFEVKVEETQKYFLIAILTHGNLYLDLQNIEVIKNNFGLYVRVENNKLKINFAIRKVVEPKFKPKRNELI